MAQNADRWQTSIVDDTDEPAEAARREALPSVSVYKEHLGDLDDFSIYLLDKLDGGHLR